MKKERVYISGPVTSIGLDEARRRFAKAEADLQKQGYRTCNPIKMRLPVWLALHCGRFGYVACLLLQLLWMWWTCQCIYLLTDWHTSDGARLERSFARCLGLTALYVRASPKNGEGCGQAREARCSHQHFRAEAGSTDRAKAYAKGQNKKSKKQKKD